MYLYKIQIQLKISISSSKQKFKTSSMSKTTMFSYLFGLVSIYVVILTVCTIIQKITTVEKLSSNKTFDKCTNSKTTILLYAFILLKKKIQF